VEPRRGQVSLLFLHFSPSPPVLHSQIPVILLDRYFRGKDFMNACVIVTPSAFFID
jgi:hypothetical protein